MSERIDGYIRVSARRGRSGLSYISPREQRANIERWAAYKAIDIGEWHVDEDQSGGTHQRPGLEAAIERCVHGETGGIISWKIDRFSRFTEHGLRDLRVLQDAGARLAFVAEDIDTNGPIGKLVYIIMLAQAEYFLEQIKAGWIVARTRAVERGAYISRTPFGYQREIDGTITPHSEHAQHVLEAYRRAGSLGVPAAAQYLADQAPVRIWTTATVRRLLARRVYLGQTDIGQFSRPTHEAIVSQAVWEVAQHGPQRRTPRTDFPLSGFATCGTCGAPMVGGHGGRDSRTRIYRCSATTGARTKGIAHCTDGPVITASRLEEYVRARAIETLAGLTVIVSDPEADTLTLLERDLAEAETELNAFAGDLHARRALGARYHKHLDSRVSAVERARERYREQARAAQANLAATTADLLSADDPQAFLVGLRSIVDTIVVIPGRGLRVEDRVRLLPLDADRPTGKAGTEES